MATITLSPPVPKSLGGTNAKILSDICMFISDRMNNNYPLGTDSPRWFSSYPLSKQHVDQSLHLVVGIPIAGLLSPGEHARLHLDHPSNRLH